MFGRGIYLIVAGLFKKAVISDYISINFVERIFDNPTLYSGVENLMGLYGYALQIYCDFSGYSDIAIGIALLLGFHFNMNFDSPYKSASITEFGDVGIFLYPVGCVIICIYRWVETGTGSFVSISI